MGGPIPAVGVDRCIAVTETTAMVFSDKAPLHNYTDGTMLPKGTFPTGSDPDFDAVWAAVPTTMQTATQSPLSVFLFFHGYNGWVTVSAASPTKAAPRWATVGPNRNKNQPALAAGPKYGLNKSLTHDPIVLVPEDGVPRNDLSKDPDPTKSGKPDGFWAKTSPGTLRTLTGLGDLLADSFVHLHNLQNTAAPATSGPAHSYLPASALSSNIKRLFIAGHSGGGVPLGGSAASTAALTIPTDLMLLDCTYNASQNQNYIDFCKAWNGQGKFGPGAGNSRLIAVSKPGTGTEANTNTIRDELKKLGLTMSKAVPVSSKTAPPTLSLGDDMVELSYGGGDLPNLPAAHLTFLQDTMTKFKAVFVKTNMAHDSIPQTFMPLLAASGTVP
jgi:hypothetical protein